MTARVSSGVGALSDAASKIRFEIEQTFAR